MVLVSLGFIFLFLSIMLLMRANIILPEEMFGRSTQKGLGALLLFVALSLLASTSFVMPGGGQVSLLERKFLCRAMPSGQNIARGNECGKQAEIIMPGFHFIPFVRVLSTVRTVPMITVPDGHYATLVAHDGKALPPGQVAARPWTEPVRKMLNAEHFLDSAGGYKGLQATVLRPGTYPINTFLFDVDVKGTALHIQQGFVGVVKSSLDEGKAPDFMPNAGEKVDCTKKSTEDTGHLAAELVPVGCRGVWRDVLPPGMYYLNQRIYDVKIVDVRIRNWVYAGGYDHYSIRVKVGSDGQVKQERTKTTKVSVPKGAAGSAVRIKVEGWNVYQDVRIQARVSAEKAPLVVAAIGGIDEVEDRIITPQVRSILRNVGGAYIEVSNHLAYERAKADLSALKSRLRLLKDEKAVPGLSAEQRSQQIQALKKQIASFSMPDPDLKIVRPTKVLDFQDNREALEALAEKKIRGVGIKAGVEITSVKFGNAFIPPELLVARKQEQLAGQLAKAFARMRVAQVQRQASEAAKARANKQGALVQAAIDVETSKRRIETEQNRGIAQRKRDEEIAKGRRALADVLGANRVMYLQMFSELLKTLQANPELVRGILPSLSNFTVVSGSEGSGLAGLGAILGNSPLFTQKKTPEVGQTK